MQVCHLEGYGVPIWNPHPNMKQYFVLLQFNYNRLLEPGRINRVNSRYLEYHHMILFKIIVMLSSNIIIVV